MLTCTRSALSLVALILVDLFVAPIRAADDDTWSYQAQDKWPPICLTGRRQSPMVINTFEALYDQSITALRFLNFNNNVNGTLTNPGNRGVRWTVDLPDEDPKLPKVMGGGLLGDYYIRYLDFRWAATDCEGSDHYLDYKPAPLEVQLVTYRSNKANSDSDNTGDSIAIFSYLFQFTNNNDNNGPFTQVFNGIDKVAQSGAIYTMNVTLQAILPPLTATPQFYRYNGSLVTPPCTESAVWTIFAAKQPISKAQMQIFRKIAGTNGLVPSAFRNLQQPYQRRIVTNVRAAGGAVAAAGTGRSDAGKSGGSGENGAASLRLNFATSIEIVLGSLLTCYAVMAVAPFRNK